VNANEATIEIKKFSSKSKGTYKCVGKNYFGREMVIFKVLLEEKAMTAPRIVDGLYDEMKITVKLTDTVELTDTLELKCEIEGTPNPIIIWKLVSESEKSESEVYFIIFTERDKNF
jgi:hypothetical protein